jgi:hypothetical protein
MLKVRATLEASEERDRKRMAPYSAGGLGSRPTTPRKAVTRAMSLRQRLALASNAEALDALDGCERTTTSRA